MRIRLADSEHRGELLRFLRARGCIAYAIGDSQVVEAMHPDALGEKKEQTRIRILLDAWLADTPSATVQLDLD